MGRSHRNKFYAVSRGREIGVFTSWDECKIQITGFSGASYKSFATRSLANQWIAESNPTLAMSRNNNSAPVASNSSSNLSRSQQCTTTHILHNRQTVWVDGSALGNNSRDPNSKAGCGVYYGERDSRNMAVKLPGNVQTNNRAELYAVILALEANTENTKLTIITDSEYAINSVGKHSHPFPQNLKNLDLLKILWKLCSKHDVVFRHVRAHTGDPGNEAADALAKLGALKPPTFKICKPSRNDD